MASRASTENDDFEEPETSLRSPSRSEIYWIDTWLFESLTLGFSIACFIALCGVLRAYDNKVRPELVYSLALNAIVSVLATGCKSSLVLVIGEAISQSKWLWFRNLRCRQLLDLQRFDAASRGPLGSLMIIIYHRGQSLVSLGAAVVLLLLAFDPFIQQVISYPMRETASDNIDGALAPQLYGWISTSADLDWWMAFEQGIWSNENFILQPTCSSGNCTWEKFSSMGICSRCTDLTTVATLKCILPSPRVSFNRTCQIVRPHGDAVNFTAASDGYTLTLPSKIVGQTFALSSWWQWGGDSSPGPNTTFDGVDPPLLTYAYAEIALNGTRISPSSPVSDRMFIKKLTECSLAVCLREYKISVTNGHTSIQTLKVDYDTIYNNWTEVTPASMDLSLCWRRGRYDGTDNPAITKFTFCDFGMMNISPYVKQLFPGVNESLWIFDEPLDIWSGPFGPYGGQTGISPNFGRIMPVGFEKTMANVAASLTKLGLSNTNHSVNGTVYVNEVIVSVQWPWLILPVLSVLTGTIFVIATIAMNRRSNTPLWKSPALASIYHGLEGGGNNEYMTASIMEKKAEREDVQLRYSESNGRLMLRTRESLHVRHDLLRDGILEDKSSKNAKPRVGQRPRTAYI